MRVDEAVDIVAIEVFETARRTGQPVTMTLTREVFAELASHPLGCCAACTAAGQAKPARVYCIAAAWESSIAASRRRAHR
jgi:hypothetical protein